MAKAREQVEERVAAPSFHDAPLITLPALVPRRRWPRRLLVALNLFVAMCLLGVAGGYGYVQWKFADVPRYAFPPDYLMPEANGPAMNVLLVGSDTRSTLSADEQKKFGSERAVGGARTDTIMILHVDPNEKKAAILSLPRDLFVPTLKDRINSAFAKGPENLVRTITTTYGIPIDHYVEVDFNGFRGIVQAVGDVNVYFPSQARDTFSGLAVKQPGCVALGGDGALAYVRSRHYQYFEGGRWHDEGDGDLGRIQRQQDFIRRVLRKVKGVRDPLTMNALVNSGIHNVTIDSAMSAKDIFKLSKRFSSLSPDTVDMQTLPTYASSVPIGGLRASVLMPKQPDADQLIARFTGKAAPNELAAQNVPAGVLPSTVRVRVLNGSGVSGQATKVASLLGPSGSGFNIAGTGDADSFRYVQSVITYGPGQLPKAQLIQAALSAPAQLTLNPALKGVDAVLVVGSDYNGIRPLPGQPGASTTMTRAQTSTTEGGAAGTPTGKSPAESC